MPDLIICVDRGDFPSSIPHPFYLPDAYVQAFDWLKGRPDRDAVLSGFATGNFIPAYTGHPVYMGHSSFTPDIAGKRVAAIVFFRHPDAAFLHANNIGYVFWGREEYAVSGVLFRTPWPPTYRKGGITIFRVPD